MFITLLFVVLSNKSIDARLLISLCAYMVTMNMLANGFNNYSKSMHILMSSCALSVISFGDKCKSLALPLSVDIIMASLGMEWHGKLPWVWAVRNLVWAWGLARV